MWILDVCLEILNLDIIQSSSMDRARMTHSKPVIERARFKETIRNMESYCNPQGPLPAGALISIEYLWIQYMDL